MDKIKEPGLWIAVAVGISAIAASAAVLLWIQS
jgi:hypothetical protein